MSEGLVQMHDGVGVVCRGNLVTVRYGADARLHRTRWLFDRIDELAARNPDGIVCLLVITPGSGPPDGPTRAENTARLKKLDHHVRMMVTVALGDDFGVSIVRTVMRTMILLSRQAAVHFVAVTEDEGIRKLLAGPGRGPQLPSRERIETDLAALRAQLLPKAAA